MRLGTSWWKKKVVEQREGGKGVAERKSKVLGLEDRGAEVEDE